jgi:hypothetical protein
VTVGLVAVAGWIRMASMVCARAAPALIQRAPTAAADNNNKRRMIPIPSADVRKTPPPAGRRPLDVGWCAPGSGYATPGSG